MEKLPAALTGLAAYRQFICWRTVERDGKLIKLPTNHEGDVIDSQDPRFYMDFETAAHYAKLNSLDVGFVFTENDPFYFVDIDKCSDPSRASGWSETADNILTYFPGAAVEVSQSGNGLHVIGTGKAPPHSMRNAQYGLEFYTEKRFIALTGRDAIGDCNTEGSAGLAQFSANLFPPRPEHDAGVEWTDGPSEKSKPIKGDEALINRALKSVSAAGGFGIRATFKQLYEGDAAALGALWPSQNELDAFDHSAADAALCQHLAFWTGGDCERIDRLFRQSGLMRGKWEDRADYRANTVLRAVGLCNEFYGAAKAAKEAAKIVLTEPVEVVAGAGMKLLGGGRVISYEDRAKYFNGHVYLTKSNDVFCPDGEVRGMTAYNGMYSTVEFAEQFGGKSINKAWDAYINIPDVQRDEAYDVCYFPQNKFGEIVLDDNRPYVNMHVKSDGPKIAGDATPFTNHVKTLLPNGRDAEILISWLAAFIQNPGKKFLWSPLIQGVEGNGKSIFGWILTKCIGSRHVTDVDPEDLCATGGKFNKWIMYNRLAIIEELKTESRVKAENTLKRLITNSRISMQAKGEDQVTVTSIINFLITTNHKDAVLILDHTRRFAPLFTAQQCYDDLVAADMHTEGGQYFTGPGGLLNWLNNCDGFAICHDFLDNYAIPAELNPAGDCDKAPRTSALLDAVQASKSGPHQAVVSALSSNIPGVRAGWVSIDALRRHLKEDTAGRRASAQMIAKFLAAEGYTKHPVLTNQGRTTRNIMEEGNVRPTIYLRANHPALAYKTPGEVTDAYISAQGYGTMGGGITVVPKTEAPKPPAS